MCSAGRQGCETEFFVHLVGTPRRGVRASRRDAPAKRRILSHTRRQTPLARRTLTAAQMRRYKLGIPPVGLKRRNWTPAEDKLLGTLPEPVNSKVLYYCCLVAVNGAGVTEVPVIVFMSDETVTL